MKKMGCDFIKKAILQDRSMEEMEKHLLSCPSCEEYLDKVVSLKDLKIKGEHNHLEFFQKFSEEPIDNSIFKEGFSCPLCFSISSTYKNFINLCNKKIPKSLEKKIMKSTLNTETFMEKFLSVAISLVLFLVLILSTVSKENLSLTFTKAQSFYRETKGKSKSLYGKLLGFGANKLKEEENELYKSQ